MGQRTLKTRVMYIELKTGYADNGPARIGRVTFSRSGRCVYYRGKRFQRIKGDGISGNYIEIESGDEYWISGVKKNRQDRHWAGSGPVAIDEDAREEYLALIRGSQGTVEQRYWQRDHGACAVAVTAGNK